MPRGKVTERLRVGAMIGFVLVGDAALHAATRGEITGVRAVTTSAALPDGDSYATGKVLLALNDLPGALAQFRQALTSAPQSADALGAVAVTYDRLGRSDVARVYYEAALAIDPDSAALNNNFGYSLYLQGDRAGAIAPLRRAAGSADAEIAATARRNLALALVEVDAHAIEALPPPGQRIERTSSGEQRLVDSVVAPSGFDSEVADATSLAAPWTPREDAVLLAAVAAAEHAERPVPPAVRDEPPAPVMLAVVVTPTPASEAPRAAGWTGSDRIHRRVALPRSAALQLRSGDVAPGTVVMAASTGPRPTRAPFDSDDHELNAFAARLQSGITA